MRLETADGHVCRLKEGDLSFDREELVIDQVALEFELPQQESVEPVLPWELAIEGVMGRGEQERDRIDIQSSRARFGSPFLSSVVSVLMPPGARETWESLELDGWFAGEFKLDTLDESEWDLWLEPTQVSAMHEGEHLEARFESGRVFMGGSGEAGGAIAGISNIGRFEVQGEARIGLESSIELDFEFEGELGSPGARAILPESLGSPLGELAWLDGEGTVIKGGHLFMKFDEAGEPLDILVEGGALLRGSGMDLGVEIRSLEASLQARYRAPQNEVPQLDVQMEIPSLEAGGRVVTDANGVMVLSEHGDFLQINIDHGQVGTGAVSLSASLAIDDENPNRSSEADDWDMELLIANADLVKLFAGRVDPETLKVPESTSSEEIEGRVHMSLFMGGRFIEPSSRRGIGRIRITDAVIGDVPIIMGIQQILHLTVPTLSRPDFVEIEYYVTGEQIVLDQILIESSLGEFSVFSMTGSGTFDYASGEIDAVLYPRGGLLVVDDIIGFVQDQVYGIGVAGPIADPEIGLVPFPKLR